MAFDPNAETSDIGMMYRQYLQQKGMPLTQGNLQSVIAQSQREPGMIAGLGVQGAPPMQASPPPNIAQASPRSSSNPQSTSAPVSTGIPQSAPIPEQNAPLPHAPFPASTPASDPASAPIKLASLSPSIPTQSAPAEIAPSVPPPGQPPTPEQFGPANPNSEYGGPQASDLENQLAGLGTTAAVMYGLKRLLRGGDYGRPGSTPQAMVEKGVPGAVAPTGVNASEVAAAVNKGAPVEGVKEGTPQTATPSRKMSPSVGEKSSPVAASIEKSVPTETGASPTTKSGAVTETPYEPAYVRRGMPGPQQGPVTAPPKNSNPYPVDDGISIPKAGSPPVPASLQRQANGLPNGPPEVTTVQRPPVEPRIAVTPEPMTATSPIGNILHDKPIGPEPAVTKPSFAEGPLPTPWKGEGAQVNPAEAAAARAKLNYPGRSPRGVRGIRLP